MLLSGQWRDYRSEMIYNMELFLGMLTGCRRTKVLSHFDPDLDASKFKRHKKCCDLCAKSLIHEAIGIKETEEKSEDFSDILLSKIPVT